MTPSPSQRDIQVWHYWGKLSAIDKDIPKNGHVAEMATGRKGVTLQAKAETRQLAIARLKRAAKALL